MIESFTWGGVEHFSAQGWMKRSSIDRRYWSAHWSAFWNMLDRDGAQTFRDDGSIQSENGKIVSFGHAVIDDFGDLRSVSIEASRFWKPEDSAPV